MKKIWIGAAYYPEMWDESEIDKDIVRMIRRIRWTGMMW